MSRLLYLALICSVTCGNFNSRLYSHEDGPRHVFNPDSRKYVSVADEGEKVIANIEQAIRENDFKELHAVLANIRHPSINKNEKYFPGVRHLKHVSNIFETLKPHTSISDSPVIRRDLIRLADSALAVRIHPDDAALYCPLKLRIMLDYVLPYEYKDYMDSSKALTTGLNSKQRPLRARQMLLIWNEFCGEYDPAWTAVQFPPNEIYNFALSQYPGSVEAEIQKISVHNDDSTEVTDAHLVRKAAQGKIDRQLNELRKKSENYLTQERLHAILPKYKTRVVEFFAVLYSFEPYDNMGLKAILTENNAEEKLSDAVFQELAERQKVKAESNYSEEVEH